MARAYSNLISIAALKVGTIAVTASAATTEFVSAALADFKSGVFIAIQALTTATGSYTFDLQGRDTSSGAYVILATVTGNTVDGVYVANVDVFKKRLRVNMTLGATSPSVIPTFLAIALEKHYMPDSGVVVTS